MEHELVVIQEFERLPERAGLILENLLEVYIQDPILLMLSGGSAGEMLSSVSPEVMSARITIAVLDERFSRDPHVNNFSLLSKSDFFNSAQNAGVSCIPSIPRSAHTLDSFAEDHERLIREWKQENPNGITIATMGVGVDGHTAGIFPFPEDPAQFNALFELPEQWVVGYEVSPKKSIHTARVTVTNSFLREEVDHALVYARGKEKRLMVARVASGANFIPEVPAQIVHEMRHVTFCTDSDLV